MMVRVVRVASLPGGISMFVDDQPDGLVIWVLEKDYTTHQTAMLEAAFNVAVWYWTRKPAGSRTNLRAV